MTQTVLGHASALAKHHGAHIVVAHCRKRAEDMRPYSRALPSFARATMVAQSEELANQEEQDLRAQLHQFMASLDIEETERPHPGTASVEFVEDFGQMADVIKRTGRLADLVAVAKPDRDRNIGTNSLQSALYQTGRPVLMCPSSGDVAPDFGAHVTIAWNGSLEASRAVAMTLDIARAARSLTILSGGKGEPHGTTADELIEYYRLRGVDAGAHRFEARNPGEALPKITAELGASLLIMGAYGQNHERETLFGGNTQVVVDRSEIPVVLVH
ncbi:universal stress protein [Roseobacter cerasinus]